MASKRHQKASDLFRAVCDLAPDARAAFLEEACAGDTELRAQVEALLTQDEQHPSFLEAPTTFEEPSEPDHKTRTRKSPAATASGVMVQPEQIGPYRILERVGEGGMGVVYVAEQREPVRRKVALKVIKLGMDTKQVLARFEVEHHALTIMNHPNIARVYDAGATPRDDPILSWSMCRASRSMITATATCSTPASGWSCSFPYATPCSTPIKRA